MEEIKLSQGKVALVDDEDYEYLNQWKWCAAKCGNTFYAVRAVSADGGQTIMRMHWEVMKAKGIDHIDRDGLNNQRSNLRLCTNSENHMNTRKCPNKSSIYKGVSFLKNAGKWRASIMINGKTIDLGLFVYEVDAARAYNLKAIKLFGDFANLNILPE